MGIIAVDQTFMDRIGSGPAESGPKLCGESDYLPLKNIWELVFALLSECQSPAVLMVYRESRPPAKYPAAKSRTGFLLTGALAENMEKIQELLLKEKVLSFYDLVRGGEVTLDISPQEDNAQCWELWVSGRGRHAAIARTAQKLNDQITLYVPKNEIRGGRR